MENNLKHRDAEEFRQAVILNNIKEWNVRNCSICNSPLYFYFEPERVIFDSRCDCTGYCDPSSEHIRDYNCIAELYNHAYSREYQIEMEKVFNLK